MTEYEVASLGLQTWSLVISVLIGAGQIGIVWYGIMAMKQASEQRAKAGEQSHAETMAALNAQSQALSGLVRSMDAQSRSLETLIERTAP